MEVNDAPSTSSAICFENCDQTSLSNLKIGHAKLQGECTGDVVTFSECKNIKLNNLDLYGCGATGLNLSECENVELNDCIIRDCSNAIIDMRYCESIFF